MSETPQLAMSSDLVSKAYFPHHLIKYGVIHASSTAYIYITLVIMPNCALVACISSIDSANFTSYKHHWHKNKYIQR